VPTATATAVPTARATAASTAAATASPTLPPGVAATLTVTQSQVAGTATLDASFASFSYEKARIDTAPGILFGPGNANLAGLLNALGGGRLRIGANTVDRTTWTPNGAGQTSGQVSQSDVRNFAGFFKQCPAWKVIYGVNYAGSQGSTASPALAASEAAYAAAQLGSQLECLEIGNEPDIYGDSNTAFLAGITYNTFLNGGTVTSGATVSGWRQFQAAMKAAAPAAAISGPAAASDGKGGPKTLPATSKASSR
jgi:hypothetical protein